MNFFFSAQKNLEAFFVLVTLAAIWYKHKTLDEIATMLEKNIITLEHLTTFQAWTCHEEHFDLEGHNAKLDTYEERWHNNNDAVECHTLCQLPTYIRNDHRRSLWSGDDAFNIGDAAEDGRNFKKAYFADAQEIFSHCHHP